MRRDWIAGIVLLGLAVGYYLLALDIPRSQLSDAVGAAAFPKLLAMVLALLSVLLVASGLRRKAAAAREQKTSEQRAADLKGFLRAGGTVLLGIAFLLIVNWVGYPIAVALLLAAMLLYNHMKLSWRVVIVAVTGGIFFWLLFGLAFSIPVPTGVWPKIFGI